MPKSVVRSRFALLIAGAAALGIATLWLVEPRVAGLWLNTTLLAAGALLIAAPLGTLLALTIGKTDVPGRNLAKLFLTAMLFLPLYVITGAWDAGFGIQGWHTLITNPHLAHEPWLRGWRAAIWVHGLAGAPWVAVILCAGLRAVEAEIEEDAATCTTPARVLWHITLPRVAPTLAVACVWVAIMAATEISVTDFFQARTFAEEVYTQAALGTLDWTAGVGQPGSAPLSAKGLWVGMLLSALLAIVALFSARRLFSQLTDAPYRPPWIWRLRRGRIPAAVALCSTMLLVAGVPLGNLIYKAGLRVTATPAGHVRSWSPAETIRRVGAAPREFRGELWLSARLSTAAATAALAIALPLAWSMRLARGVPWVRFGVIALCLTVPGPLLGIATIHLLNRPPESMFAPLAALYDSNFAPWCVQTVRALPVVTLILWASLASIPQPMFDAALTAGAGWWARLMRIAIPQRWPAVAAAWLVGLAMAVSELGATVLVIPPQPSTAISVRVFQLLHYGVDDRVAAICLLMVALVAMLTALAAGLLKRPMT